MSGEARVGMSGWVYPPWRGVFYPRGLPQKDELAYAASHVTSIEINGSFYSLHKPSSWEHWRDSTPDDFVFAVKGPRFVTHIKRLREVRLPLANFFASGVLALGPKLGPLLWQLPPTLKFDAEVVQSFLRLLPQTTTDAAALGGERDNRMTGREWLGPVVDRPLRHAIEVRHASFETEEFFSLLAQHGVASVVADTAGKFPRIDRTTAAFGYARLHGDTKLYESGYDDAALDRWATRVREWLDAGLDAYVYFDNDIKVRAPVDAMSLIRRLST